MDKETKGKKGKWLWLVLGVVAVLAVAVLAFVLFFNNSDDGDKLYWNVGRGVTRKPSADGTYTIMLSCEGEQVNVTVPDKRMVEYIDTMDVMNLTLDRKSCVVEVKAAKDIYSVVGEGLYIKQVTENSIIFNTNDTMTGDEVVVKMTDQLRAYNVSGNGKTVGQEIELKKLNAMNAATIYGVPASEGGEIVATHIFVTQRYEDGKVFWRTKKHYDSTNKTTIREPDENGVYTASFYCDGETVDIKFKDKDMVTKIDSVVTSNCHYGFVLNDAGYAVELIDSNIATNTLLQCERYDITEIKEDGSYVAAEIIKYHGSEVVEGKIGADCAIYDVSAVAKVEGAVNRKLDTLRVGDRVCIWTDTLGNPVLIYITARQVDSPAYYNPDPQYDAATKKTKRTRNADGYFEIELLEAGAKELQTFYTQSESTVNTIDKNADHCVGLQVTDGNIIEYVYDMDSVFGQSYFCRGSKITKVSEDQITADKKKGTLAEDCKIWNVSDTGEFGAETELQVGDVIYAGRNPDGEIINVYVISRDAK